MNYSMLLQDATPDTSGYMIAGYVIFVVLMAIYLISFLARKHNLEQDLSTLRTLEAETQAKAPERSVRKPSPRKAAPSRGRASGRVAPHKRSARKRR